MTSISSARRPSAPPARHRAAASVAAAAAVLAAAGGCAPAMAPALGHSPSGATASSLSFRYDPNPGVGSMDQLLEITNTSGESLVPTLRIIPLDQDEQPVPGVTVTTAYGSDRGRLVVGTAGYADALAFHGDKADQVWDVRVVVVALTVARRPAGEVEELEPTPEDAVGNPVNPSGSFTQVVLSNPNDTPVWVRIVYIIWQEDVTGLSQQADTVTPIGGLISVPAHGTVTVPVDGDAAAAVAKYGGGKYDASVKVFPSQ